MLPFYNENYTYHAPSILHRYHYYSTISVPLIPPLFSISTALNKWYPYFSKITFFFVSFFSLFFLRIRLLFVFCFTFNSSTSYTSWFNDINGFLHLSTYYLFTIFFVVFIYLLFVTFFFDQFSVILISSGDPVYFNFSFLFFYFTFYVF